MDNFVNKVKHFTGFFSVVVETIIFSATNSFPLRLSCVFLYVCVQKFKTQFVERTYHIQEIAWRCSYIISAPAAFFG